MDSQKRHKTKPQAADPIPSGSEKKESSKSSSKSLRSAGSKDIRNMKSDNSFSLNTKASTKRRERGGRGDRSRSRNDKHATPQSYPPHWKKIQLKRDPNKNNIVKGKLRVVTQQMAFVTPDVNESPFCQCNKSIMLKDILIEGKLNRNRALNSDIVYVELLDIATSNCIKREEESSKGNEEKLKGDNFAYLGGNLQRQETSICEVVSDVPEDNSSMHQQLWDPIVSVPNHHKLTENILADGIIKNVQYNGRVIYISDESYTSNSATSSKKIIVGRIDYNKMNTSQKYQESSLDPIKIVPLDKRLPYFIPARSEVVELLNTLLGKDKGKTSIKHHQLRSKQKKKWKAVAPTNEITKEEAPLFNKTLSGLISSHTIIQGQYNYGTWLENHSLPPIRKLSLHGGEENDVNNIMQDLNLDDGSKNERSEPVTKTIGDIIHQETYALLAEHEISSYEFGNDIIKEVETSLGGKKDVLSKGWKPTEDDLKDRRDFRDYRIFTIDPTTARDLDDALHIRDIGMNQVEVGVHIADVSHFVQQFNTNDGTPSKLDEEAQSRATTVYLVDRVIPMLPRPLCEVACSLNEGVERLAFSVVWVMNMDGTLASGDPNDVLATSKRSSNDHYWGKGIDNDTNTLKDKKDLVSSKMTPRVVWYGKSVIKSCARLDYKTAQNIIDGLVCKNVQIDEVMWPSTRRPIGSVKCEEVASDVRLLHRVAMNRRKLRFDHGAIALNSVKLVFKYDENEEKVQECEPYPIKESNQLVEEYMLLANYLVAERLLTHAGGRALLRRHHPPLSTGLGEVVFGASLVGYNVDPTHSGTLQSSLNRIGRECNDPITIQSLTCMLTQPMKPAEYIAAGEFDKLDWRHFALNIPYYTHFTSPIRRYPDIIVHRLLQATLEDSVDDFRQSSKEINEVALHCNEKRMNSKHAQERSDRVFLCLFLKFNPIKDILGVVVGVGEKTFTVFIPDLGVNDSVFLDEHKDLESEIKESKRWIILRKKKEGTSWDELHIKLFTRLRVSCRCRERTPIDLKIKIVGPLS